MSDLIEDLRQRWEEEPSPRLSLHLAEEYRRLDRPRDAVDVLLRALEDHPRHVASRVALGRFRLDLGELEEARTLLEQVVAEDPTHLVASKLLVKVYLKLGEGKQARDRLDLYRLLNEGDPEIEVLEQSLDRATGGNGTEPFSGLWEGVGDASYWEAIGAEGIFPTETMEPLPAPEPRLEPRAAEEAPATATVTLANLYLEQGHWDDAEQVFEEVLQREPGSSEALEGIAEIHRLRAVEPPPGPIATAEAEHGAAELRFRKVLMLKDYLRRLRAAAEER